MSFRFISLVVAVIIVNVEDVISQPVYYPLQPGNIWQYTSSYRDRKITGDTLMPGGFTYAVEEDHHGYKAYFRQEENKVYQYLPNDSTEATIYDFDANNNDTIWKYEWGGYTMFEHSRMDWVFGKYVKIYVFATFHSPGLITHADEVVDSMGITMSVLEPAIFLHLQGAVINGVTYGTITQLEDKVLGSIPATFILKQNYPNPFNPATNFGFHVADFGFISLRIFNVMGEEVATVVNKNLLPGEYTISWDAGYLPSGVYYYRLTSGAESQTRTMTVLK